MTRVFFQYYKEKSHPRGCVAVLVDTETQVFKTGWSMYNKNHEMRPFTKKLARIIALGRASDGMSGWLDRGAFYMPSKLYQTRESLIEICQRWITRNDPPCTESRNQQ